MAGVVDRRPGAWRWFSGALVVVALAVGVPVALTSRGGHRPPRAGASVRMLAIPVFRGEQRLDGPTARSGNLAFDPIAVDCAIAGVIGTHAETFPRGIYCRFRVAISNVGQTYETFDPAGQRMLTTSGDAFLTDRHAMLARRQADRFSVPPRDLLTLELWWDVPRGTVVTGFELSAEDQSVAGRIPLPHPLVATSPVPSLGP